MALEISSLVPVKNLDTIVAETEKAAKDLTKEKENEQLLQGLAAYIRERWNLAVNAKASTIDPRLLLCKRAVRCEYDAKKRQAIASLYGKEFDPPYPPLIATKRRDMIAWMRDFLLRADVDLFDITPTPMPELPESMNDQILEDAEKKAFDTLAIAATQSQRPMVKDSVQKYAQALLPDIKDQAQTEVTLKAKEAVMRMKKKIDDQFKEGDFDDALKALIDDIAQYPNAFIEGPIQQKVPVQKMVHNADTGKWEMQISEEIISKYERFSPHDAFPQSDARSIDDGYFFRKIAFTPSNLSDMLDVDGYDSEAITKCLELYRSGGLREWTAAEAARAHLEDRDTVAASATDKIDAIKYWGSVPGEKLLEWAGAKGDTLFGMTLNPVKEYQCVVWMVGTFVIKAMLNDDPLGKKNVFKAAFDDDPDNFWSPTSLPETLWDIQTSVNSIARSIVLNVGFASGPQIEYDKDRFPDGVTPQFYPLKQWASTGSQMRSGKPINFWQPEIMTDRLQSVYEFHRSLADEYSGIPRYMQGESKGSNATASGLSMQISQSSRGLKSVLTNIDFGVIEPAVQAQYQFNLRYEDDIDMVGDCKIVAKGAASIIAKEQLAVRRKEYLGVILASQAAVTIIGQKGLRELLKSGAQSLDLDLDKIFGEDQLLDEMAELMPSQPPTIPGQPGAVPPPGTPEKPMGVNPAGDKASGGDFALVQPQPGTAQ